MNMSPRPHLPPPPSMAKVRGECHRCDAPIVFGDFERLDRSTGWVWSTEPGAHLQPLCSRCKRAEDDESKKR